MNRIRIRPRLTKAQMKTLIGDIGPILSGEKRNRYQIREVFFGTMANYIYTKMRQSFLQKSAGSSDDVGSSWDMLSEATIRRKLSESFQRRYPGANRGINRVDDTLLASLSPGTFDGIRYTPSPNQDFKYEKGELTLGTKLKYASHVDAKRKLWPEDMTPWISESISKAIEATIIHIKKQVE